MICGAFEATHTLLAVGARRDLRNSRGKLLGGSSGDAMKPSTKRAFRVALRLYMSSIQANRT